MVRYHVEFDVEVDGEYSDEDIEAWIRFELHTRGGLPLSCPLSDRDLDAVGGSVFVRRTGPIVPKMLRLKRGNVIRNKQTGDKACLSEDMERPDTECELVCENAHDDGDFSYLCNNHYCKCWQ